MALVSLYLLYISTENASHSISGSGRQVGSRSFRLMKRQMISAVIALVWKWLIDGTSVIRVLERANTVKSLKRWINSSNFSFQN